MKNYKLFENVPDQQGYGKGWYCDSCGSRKNIWRNQPGSKAPVCSYLPTCVENRSFDKELLNIKFSEDLLAVEGISIDQDSAVELVADLIRHFNL